MRKCLTAGSHQDTSSAEVPSSLMTLACVELAHKTSQYSTLSKVTKISFRVLIFSEFLVNIVRGARGTITNKSKSQFSEIITRRNIPNQQIYNMRPSGNKLYKEN